MSAQATMTNAALRVVIINLKNRVQAQAAELEHAGDPERARWLRNDVAQAEAALQGPGALMLWHRQQTRGLSDAA